MFAKYDFTIADDDTRVNFKVDVPNDKYLLKYMRVKIIDKSDRNQIQNQQTFN